ncbi:MAG: ABC transporter permease [Hyphomonadaceae bacterium]
MKNILLVAIREYKQLASTRGFWVMLLVLPLVIAGTQIAGRFFRPQLNSAYVLVDTSGQFESAIDRRLNLNYQRVELGGFSAYAQRWDLGGVAPDAIWAKGDRWFTDAQIDQFVADGGIVAAMALVKPHLPKDAPVYDVDPPTFVRAPLPAGVTAAEGPDAIATALSDELKDEIATPEGNRPLALVVYIPETPSAATPVRMWTNGAPNSSLVDNVRNEISRIQRSNALQASGLTPEAAASIMDITTPIDLSAPRQGLGREQVIIRSALPLVMVYLLLVTVMTTGSMMLQGVIEERSNKLLESILATIRPADLMYGKLLGLGAIGLTILGVWVGAAVGAAFFVQGMVADIVKPSLSAIEPWMFGAMLFYFLAGYLIISMLYLAIGALSNSLQDAQAYLMPVIMLIMLPTIFMMLSVVQQPNGVFPIIMSWIPLYTPFAMLARLGAGVDFMEVLGTGLMLVVFVGVEMLLLGRLFQASLLRTGQPPKLGAFLGMMLGKNTG